MYWSLAAISRSQHSRIDYSNAALQNKFAKYLQDIKQLKFTNIKNFFLDVTSVLKYFRHRDLPIIYRDVKLGVGK